ncbi:MAG: hypothetical protein OXU37_08090 [Thaumarchaeota archaeon]|nr:hypothetical protein [Nitrososphaerota archaeon]
MIADSRLEREALAREWNARLAASAPLWSDGVEGSSPPSVFVGSHGYPRLGAGPLVPAAHGDTGLLGAPERWGGMSLAEIVSMRLRLVRGVRAVRAGDTGGRYVESLQEVAMASRPADAELRFGRPAAARGVPDGHSAPFGPVGEIESATFSGAPALRALERARDDTDLGAAEAVMSLYRSGVEVTRIQACLSVGMLGRRRRLVPTRWGITAVDSAVSHALSRESLAMPEIDSWRVHFSERLGNLYAVVLFPHAWRFEMVEAWQRADGTMAFGSDSEGHGGIRHAPAIAGAYHAARLAVCEHLVRAGAQAGALVLREIRPEYSVPVGVWQVREGVREAMRSPFEAVGGMDEAIALASSRTSVSAAEWVSHGATARELRQRTLAEFT